MKKRNEQAGLQYRYSACPHTNCNVYTLAQREGHTAFVNPASFKYNK